VAHEETVYEALEHADSGEGQWAFGTGFDDPLAGVDTTVPDGIDPADLGAYCLMLGDDALVLSQRLTEWITAAPEL
jgi:ring-1,2-phenylacetyl-CoA epoxidase subunit PaaC